MPVIPHLESLAAVADQSRSKEHFALNWRDFLDGFYARPNETAFKNEPRMLRDTVQDNGYADAFLGSLAEHLARQYRFAAPGWCFKHERFLEQPTFAFKTAAGRMFLLVESPTAFRSRNIFISADALTRA